MVAALNVTGLGLHIGHLTREVEGVLAECEHVYYLHGDPEIVAFLTSGPAELTDLSDFYSDETSRLETYYRIASRIIFHASQGPRIGVAVYGHPTIFSTLVGMLVDGSRRFGVEVAVYPGISSLDAICAGLRLDPGAVALQVHEATELLIFDRQLDAREGLLIFQAGQLGTRLHTTKSSAPDRMSALIARLEETYGATHWVTALEAQGLRPGWTWRGRLADLRPAAAAFGASFTIYVPPTSRPAIRDATVLEGLDAPARLEALVR